jgi:hypothetical protein
MASAHARQAVVPSEVQVNVFVKGLLALDLIRGLVHQRLDGVHQLDPSMGICASGLGDHGIDLGISPEGQRIQVPGALKALPCSGNIRRGERALPQPEVCLGKPRTSGAERPDIRCRRHRRSEVAS